jgi:hypothetical protein
LLFLAGAVAGNGAQTTAPDQYRLFLYKLLDLDQHELFDGEQYTPLAELNAWSNLYIKLRDAAQSDSTADRRHIKSFLLAGWIARKKGDFSTVEAFNTDFMRIFESKPKETLRVLAEEDFLLEDMCIYLAKFFFFEDNDPQQRHLFVNQHREEMSGLLGAERAKLCLEVFWQVES